MELIREVSKGKLQDGIIYRGEGNSSIVIALKNRAKVIRFLKKDGKIMKSSLDHHLTQHPMRSIKFIHLIMRPLTSPYLGGPTELVHLKLDLINKLSKRVEAERPLDRLDKTLHLDDQYALVMDDLCTIPPVLLEKLTNKRRDLCGPTISVEIKPKQGFLPIHGHVMKSAANDQLLNVLRNSCLYGSTQFLKLARGRIKEMSNYCPVSLFSGCPVKMRLALEALLRNPQNNFRIFKDLSLAYDQGKRPKFTCLLRDFLQPRTTDDKSIPSVSCVEHERQLLDILVQCLLSESTVTSTYDRNQQKSTGLADGIFGTDENLQIAHRTINGGVCLRHTPVTLCELCDNHAISDKPKTIKLSDHETTHMLPPSCVLASVLRAQQLDTVGAHEARRMLDWLLENSSSIDVLEELSRPQIPHGFGSPNRVSNESEGSYYCRKVWEFLVSLTAKDCSIIITLRRIRKERYGTLIKQQPSLESHIITDNRSGSHFLFNVGIADLDQKMPLKIHRICENLNQTMQQLMIHDELIYGNKDNP